MRILVTGGSGSFGKALARRLAHKVDRFVVYSRSEHLQEAMSREISAPSMRYFIGDVRDLERLRLAMRGIDTVIHAAALKIIPSCEYNPFETIQTNVIGGENVVKAALGSDVSHVVALSTDKACAPVNLYGASKLAAEKIFVAANNLAGSMGPKFSVVRYGNVADSNGSVIPLFRRLAAQGKPLPITDVRMTRFWITLDQAVDFVLSRLTDMVGREIFIPKLPSVRIITLASAVGKLYNKSQERDIIGIRDGEKLHESLFTTDESRFAVSFGDRYIIRPDHAGPEGPAYTSDTNKDWVTHDQLMGFLRAPEAAPIYERQSA